MRGSVKVGLTYHDSNDPDVIIMRVTTPSIACPSMRPPHSRSV